MALSAGPARSPHTFALLAAVLLANKCRRRFVTLISQSEPDKIHRLALNTYHLQPCGKRALAKQIIECGTAILSSLSLNKLCVLRI